MRLPFSSLVLFFLVSILPATSMAASTSPSSASSILVIGDSLSAAYGIERSEGWVSLLEQFLAKNGHPYRVINASVSGDTTRAGLARLPVAIKQHQPGIIIIALGGNDGLRGVSLKEFRHNLEQMITLGKQAGAKIVLCGVRVPPNLGVTYISRFLQIYRETAKKFNVPLVNYILKNVSSKPELMQKDGIHPTAQAQPIILQNVLEQLQPLI